MTTYLIYGDTADNSLASGNATYATARSGGTISLGDSTSALMLAGHTLPGGTMPSSAASYTPALNSALYNCYEAFISFDTSSIPTSGVALTSATLRTYDHVDSGVTYTGINVHSYDWGTSVTTADWVPGATAAALPLRASWPAQAVNGARSDVFDTAGVVAGGSTRLLMVTQNFDLGITTGGPTFTTLGSGNAATSQAPYLRVVVVALTTLTNVQHASVQMPGQVKNGEPAVVSIRSNGLASPTLTLGYTTLNSTTFTTIATLSGAEFDIAAGQSTQNIALAVAPNGDIFVVGSRVGVAYAIAVKAFVKSGTASWTAKASIYTVVPGATGTVDWFSFACAYVRDPVTDCIFVVASSPMTDTQMGWACLNVANARAGAGSALISSGTNPSWHYSVTGSSNILPWLMSVASRGTDGKAYVATAQDHNVLTISAGAITGSGTGYATTNTTNKVQALALGPDSFLKIYDVTTGDVRLFKRGTATSGSSLFTVPASLFQGGVAGAQWSAVWDERAGLVRIYYAAATARMVSRVDFNPTTNVVSSATVISSTVGSVGSVIQSLRTVENTLDERAVMIECAVTTAGVLSTAVVLDTGGNIVPNAPTLGVRNAFIFSDPATFTWTASDPNLMDTQRSYDLQIQRVSDSVDVVNVVGTVSAVGSHLLAGSTLANNIAYRWRVRTYDQLNTQGAWSAYSTFSTSDAPIVVITTPATDNLPTDRDDATITWSFTTASGSTQAQRRIRLIRTSDSAVISDTTMQASTSQTGTVSGMLSDIEYRVEVSTLSSTGIASNTATRLITPSYSSALTPTFTAEPQPGLEYILLTISNPESGDRPLVLSNEIWKRRSGEAAYARVATGVENDGSYRDYAVASGQAYDYFVRAVY